MNDKMSKIINHPATIPTVTGVVSLGVGAVIGYILGRKKTIEYYEEEVPAQMTFDFSDVARTSISSSAGEAVEALNAMSETLVIEREPILAPPKDEVAVGEAFIAEKLKESMTSHHEEEPEVVAKSVFAETDDDWNYDEELKLRSSSLPYVLHKDEFYAEELNYNQYTLTYYSGDNIMANEEDTPVYNHEHVVGELKFGHGSQDPNIFYARNDKLRSEYEVIFDSGLYSVEVLGLEIENNARVQDLKHSGNRKFKME